VQVNGSTELVALPKLTALRQATAYAVAAAHQRGWLHLVRPCLYLKNRKASTRHYFLADDPRQRFCSTSHSNLYRQYKYIDKHGRPDARRPRRHK